MNENEDWVECVDRHGVTEYNEAGIPVVFRWICRNRKCKEKHGGPKEGFHLVHRQTLYGVQNEKPRGEVASSWERNRPLIELIDLLPPERVRRE